MSKPRPGQYRQLTLFPQPKPTDQHRWPRGYTPERMAEVRQAMGDVGVYVNTSVGSDESKPSSFVHRPVPGETKSSDLPAITTEREGFAERRVAEVIARSTMPADVVSRQQFTDRTGRERTATLSISVNAAPAGWGNYSNGVGEDVGDLRGYVQIHSNLQNVKPGDAAGTRLRDEITLMHELGHHRSVLEGNPHSVLYDDPKPYTPAVAGKEEGRADRNVIEHYRAHPKDKPFVPAEMASYDPSSYFGYDSRKLETFDRSYYPSSRLLEVRRAAPYNSVAEAAWRSIRGEGAQQSLLDEDAKTVYRTIPDEEWQARGKRYLEGLHAMGYAGMTGRPPG
jgi:hypothetical protein